MTREYALFPGCSGKTTGLAYTESFSYVAKRLGLRVDEIRDWSCCGSGVASGSNPDLASALPARNLALAEAQFGDRPVLALCAGCYQSLRRGLVAAREGDAERTHIERLIDKPYAARAEVVNGIEVFLDNEVADSLRAQVVAPLSGLRVACYYGCMLLRPRTLCSFDDEENPTTMERVVALSGAEPIDWSFKTECCGASHQVSMAKTTRPLIDRIFNDALENGADAIACACPLCMLNLDMREAEVNRRRRAAGLPEIDIPVYYFTELLASSLGALPNESGIARHFHPAQQLVADAMARGVDEVLARLNEQENKPKLSPEDEAFEAKLAGMDPEKAAKVRAAREAKRRKQAEQARAVQPASAGEGGASAEQARAAQPSDTQEVIA